MKSKIWLMTVALIVLCLTGCATNRPVIEPCDHPERDGETYRAWLEWATELDGALRECNTRIEATQ